MLTDVIIGITYLLISLRSSVFFTVESASQTQLLQSPRSHPCFFSFPFRLLTFYQLCLNLYPECVHSSCPHTSSSLYKLLWNQFPFFPFRNHALPSSQISSYHSVLSNFLKALPHPKNIWAPLSLARPSMKGLGLLLQHHLLAFGLYSQCSIYSLSDKLTHLKTSVLGILSTWNPLLAPS